MARREDFTEDELSDIVRRVKNVRIRLAGIEVETLLEISLRSDAVYLDNLNSHYSHPFVEGFYPGGSIPKGIKVGTGTKIVGYVSGFEEDRILLLDVHLAGFALLQGKFVHYAAIDLFEKK